LGFLGESGAKKIFKDADSQINKPVRSAPASGLSPGGFYYGEERGQFAPRPLERELGTNRDRGKENSKSERKRSLLDIKKRAEGE